MEKAGGEVVGVGESGKLLGREDGTWRGLHAAGVGGERVSQGLGEMGPGRSRKQAHGGPVVWVNCGDFHLQSRGAMEGV